MRELVAREGVREAVAISTCNRTEIYLVVSDPVQAETRAPGQARAARADPPDRAAAGRLLAAQLRRRAAPLPRDERPGLDDRRRDRGPGPGAPRLRGRAGRRDDRPVHQPPVPRGAPDRQAGAHRDGREPGARQRPLGRGRPRRARRSATCTSARSLIIGAGETAELTARALHEQGVRTMFVANRRADRARALAERFGGRVGSLDELPDRLVDADIVVASTSSPHPIVGAERAAGRDGRPRRTPDRC